MATILDILQTIGALASAIMSVYVIVLCRRILQRKD